MLASAITMPSRCLGKLEIPPQGLCCTHVRPVHAWHAMQCSLRMSGLAPLLLTVRFETESKSCMWEVVLTVTGLADSGTAALLPVVTLG